MKYLSNNLVHLRKQKCLSQKMLAKDLNITRSRISSYEEGRSLPSLNFMIDISEYYGITVDILLKSNLTIEEDVNFINLNNNRILFPITIDNDNEDLIEIIPTTAQAGYLSGYDDPEYIEQLKKIKLPFLPTGQHRAFPIKGDSMLPIKDGAYVIGKFIEDPSEIKDGKTYILVTQNDGIVYKRIKNNLKSNNTLELISDNNKYESYAIHLAEILEIWEFACSINTQEYTESELQISSILTMFTELGIQLEQLKKVL